MIIALREYAFVEIKPSPSPPLRPRSLPPSVSILFAEEEPVRTS